MTITNDFFVEKHGIIIDETLFDNTDGNNINGPSIIKVPDFIKNPLGKYYLYFAHHVGKYIRMAYSDSIFGPYKLYKKGALHLKNTPGYGHCASPDIIIDNENKKIIMYYHCPYNQSKTFTQKIKSNNQLTFYAYSPDGLNFVSEKISISHPYFRYFVWNNTEYGIAMCRHECSIIYKKINNVFTEFSKIIKSARHTAIFNYNNKLYVVYSIVGDNPEHILISEISDIEKGITSDPKTLIYPELEYEHGNKPKIKSKYGPEYEKVNQLRDPYVYIENDNIYILYTVCGEKGIAIATFKI